MILISHVKRLCQLCVLHFLALFSCAQGTIHVDFSGVPPNATLSDYFNDIDLQFSSHNFDIPGLLPPPSLPDSPAGNVAWVFSPRGAEMFFRKPVLNVSLRFTLENLIERGEGQLRLGGREFDSVGAGAWSTLTPAAWGSWQSAQISFTPGADVHFVDITAYNLIDGFNHGCGIYFTDIDVTFVPEPSAVWLFALSGTILLAFAKRSIGNRSI